MSLLTRTAYAFYYLEHDRLAEAVSLLRGEDPDYADSQIVALGILTGERHSLSRDEFDLLRSVPAGRWVRSTGLDERMVSSLLGKGLLLSDADDPTHARLRDREEALSAHHWNLYGALYHYMTQWRGVIVERPDDPDGDTAFPDPGGGREFVARYGPPPPPFGEPRTRGEVALPHTAHDGELYRTLLARRTARDFDPDAPMSIEQLSTVLRYVFGAHGSVDAAAEVVCIRRTSPSGGALHPVEAYPIVMNVAGVRPGIYHYNCRDHALGLLEPLEPGEGRRLATSFMCGQSFFADAHVCFALTARFERSHWKYRWHQRAYAAILMDAAHLSQTLYLVSTELGLGAFVTVAINGRDIEQRLGLDGVREGVIAMTGCGVTAR